MRKSGQLTILNVIDMNPDKHGIIELQFVEMAAQAAALGWRLICCFNQDAPTWFQDVVASHGAELVPVAGPGGPGSDRIVDLASKVQADIIHLHFVRPWPLTSKLYARGHRRILQTEHTFSLGRYLDPARAIVKHYLGRHIGMFIAVSEYVARQIKRDYLVPASRIRLIKNGVNLDLFAPRRDKYELRRSLLGRTRNELIIACAAWLHPRKRLEIAVAAMPEILAAVPNTALVLAGRGPEQGRLQALIDQSGLDKHVTIMDGNDLVERIYAASDIGVLPSLGEAMPGGAIEAMACGLPLVATPNGGLAEVPEHGVSGFLVHDQTAHGLAQALVPLLQNAELRERMGLAARKRAEQKFDVRHTVEQTMAAYRDLLAD